MFARFDRPAASRVVYTPLTAFTGTVSLSVGAHDPAENRCDPPRHVRAERLQPPGDAAASRSGGAGAVRRVRATDAAAGLPENVVASAVCHQVAVVRNTGVLGFGHETLDRYTKREAAITAAAAAVVGFRVHGSSSRTQLKRVLADATSSERARDAFLFNRLYFIRQSKI